MKLVFYHPYVAQRKETLSFKAMQEGSGFSGTDTALVEVANYLASQGHDVSIVGIVRDQSFWNDKINYISWNDIMCKTHDYFADIDFFCPLFFLYGHEHDTLIDKLDPSRTVLWVWMHCFVNDHAIDMYRSKHFRVCASFMSPYVEQNYDKSKFLSHVTIGNGVGNMFLKEGSADRKGNWTFHAVFERGGAVAWRVFNYVRQRNPESAQRLQYASYYTDDHLPFHDNSVVWRGSLSKNQISEMLSTSDYFVYPLVLNSNSVHHDTFGSVILEALASGVIVITWDVACIPSVYGDKVIALTPQCEDGYNPSARYGSNRWMNSEEAVAMLGDKILELERDPVKKEEVRQRGIQWARTQTWNTRARAYEEWLTSMIPSPKIY